METFNDGRRTRAEARKQLKNSKNPVRIRPSTALIIVRGRYLRQGGEYRKWKLYAGMENRGGADNSGGYACGGGREDAQLCRAAEAKSA